MITSQDLSEAAILYRKARELMDENSIEDAIAIFEKSISIDPHFKTLELLGECYVRQNRLREAIIPLAASATLNRNVRAISLLAEVFLKLNDFNKAKEMAEVALMRDSSNKIANSVLKAIIAFEKDNKRSN